MKYLAIKEDEDLSETIRELEKGYTYSEELAEINVADCEVYKRGQVWVIGYEGKVIYYETHSEPYPFFETALHFMNPFERAEWKTVGNLRNFRQAIREDAVNWRGLADELETPLSESDFNEFMEQSRAADLVHHGQHTF